ncbi:Aminotransferase class I/classII [Lasiodiplodia theobromae]|nr:Aminotransferase class I/classII [Lasiodiplodia theobromae]
MSQLMLFKLLDKTWVHEDYADWLIHIQDECTTRRNVIVGACEKYLPSVVTWDPPMAGMYHWVEADCRKHPHTSSKSITELREDLFLRSVEKGSLIVRSSWIRPEAGLDLGNERMFFRASFAAAPFGSIEEAIRRFGLAVKESFQL